MKCKTSIIAIAVVTLIATQQGFSQSPYPGGPQGYGPQPAGFVPQQGPPQGYMPQQGPPQGYMPQQGPPQGYMPQQGPPQGYMPQQGPPQGYMPQQGPPQGYMPQHGPQMPPPNSVFPAAYQMPLGLQPVAQDTSIGGGDAYGGETCGTCGGVVGVCGHDKGVSPFFGSVEYLLWWRQGQSAPALATTSPAGTARSAIGVLPNAQILFGDQRYDDGLQQGGRITAGLWTDDLHEISFGGRAYFVGQDRVDYNALSGGTPNLARPFTNVTDPNNIVQAADLIAFTDPAFGNAVMSSGSINANLTNDFWGAEFFGTVLMDRGPGYRIDVIGGYQYTRIDDALNVGSALTVQDANFANLVAVGTTIARNDVFDTQNKFNGGFLGFTTEIQEGHFSLRLMGKVGVGNMNQQVRISGSSVTQIPAGAAVTTAEGLLARTSNIGTYTRDKFAYVPEVGITLGYAMNDCLKFTVGSTFIYWSDVTRAGDAVDMNLDLSAAPNTQPAFVFRSTDFWAVGANFGMEARF